MFHLLRFAIWITGTVTLVLFGIRYFGYEPNPNYWSQQTSRCEGAVSSCRGILFWKGVDGVRDGCKWNCIDPELLIRKTE
jgi:hypothetical protein